MIFGFNTDVRAQGTVYHVQTEVREQECQLESQVFVSGRCTGKRSAALPSGASDEDIQESARTQHRLVVEAVREGFVDDVLNKDIPDELIVRLLGSQRGSGEEVVLRFQVLSGGFVAAMAEVQACWKVNSGSGALATAITNEAGAAEMRLPLVDGAAELEVTVHLGDRETVRRFLIKTSRA